MIRAVLFDLDGVIRHFDPENSAATELRHGVDAGAIARFAFSSPVIEQVTTGRITRRQWVEQIGADIGNAHAADEWSRYPAVVDPEMIALADDVRSLGYATAILTNGTDTIAEEAAELGLTDHFDPIFNSADIGFAKPDSRVFEHVLLELGITGTEVFFTDDSADKLVGAQALGFETHLFRGVPGLRAALREHNLKV